VSETTPLLHYIFDPLCGWCYAAEPLVAVARDLLPVQLHGGGMMAGALRRPVSPEFRSFVLRHDRQIARASGAGRPGRGQPERWREWLAEVIAAG